MNKEIGNKLIDFADALARFSKAIEDKFPTLEPAAFNLQQQADKLRDAIYNAPVTP